MKVDAATSSMLAEADVTNSISLEILKQKLFDGYGKTIGTMTRTSDDPKAKENMFADLLKRVFPTWTDDKLHNMLLLAYSSQRSDNKDDVYTLFRSITLAYYTTLSLDSIQVVPIVQVVTTIPVPHTFDPSQLEPTPNTPIQDPKYATFATALRVFLLMSDTSPCSVAKDLAERFRTALKTARQVEKARLQGLTKDLHHAGQRINPHQQQSISSSGI